MATKAIVINKPLSSSPETWELDEDPNWNQMDRFIKGGKRYEVRKVFERELLPKINGKFKLDIKKYHVFPASGNPND